jgi:hypothetical protein
MRKLFYALLLVTLTTCVPLSAATATDFYVELLRRGIADVEAGRNDVALTPLRLAAFGLLDSVEHYEIAEAHLVVALDRLNQVDAAREAALRIVAAERVERRFASLAISNEIRNAFAASAKKLLSAGEVAVLLNPQAPVPPTTARVTPGPPPQTKPAPVTEKPIVEKKPVETTPVETKPPPPMTSAPVQKPAVTPPAPIATTTAPKTTPPVPKPAPVKPTIDVPARLAAGERALVAANLNDARRTYRELLGAGGHDHDTWIRVAEGLYRSRDFAGALTAFQHVGTLRAGEEAYRYYIAVAYFETGQLDRAKRELAAALPHIETTPDVQRYRAKIENAR